MNRSREVALKLAKTVEARARGIHARWERAICSNQTPQAKLYLAARDAAFFVGLAFVVTWITSILLSIQQLIRLDLLFWLGLAFVVIFGLWAAFLHSLECCRHYRKFKWVRRLAMAVLGLGVLAVSELSPEWLFPSKLEQAVAAPPLMLIGAVLFLGALYWLYESTPLVQHPAKWTAKRLRNLSLLPTKERNHIARYASDAGVLVRAVSALGLGVSYVVVLYVAFVMTILTLRFVASLRQTLSELPY